MGGYRVESRIVLGGRRVFRQPLEAPNDYDTIKGDRSVDWQKVRVNERRDDSFGGNRIGGRSACAVGGQSAM